MNKDTGRSVFINDCQRLSSPMTTTTANLLLIFLPQFFTLFSFDSVVRETLKHFSKKNRYFKQNTHRTQNSFAKFSEQIARGTGRGKKAAIIERFKQI